MTESPNPHNRPKPVVLCILDGWGHRQERSNNAIAMAETPTWDKWMADGPAGFPHALVEASGPDVGLPDGQMGNSEVGHMNIGAGRVLRQDLPKIDAAIADGSLAQNTALSDFIAGLKSKGGTCHILGLLSPGGVHSHQDHIVALAEIVSAAGVPICIHAFLDGRDTPPQSARSFVEKFSMDITDCPDTVIATVSGRYFAMDRDKRWDRVERAYNAMVLGKGHTATNAQSAIEAAYESGITDEFIEPAVLEGFGGIKDYDGLLMANFRADRARQILTALVDPNFHAFKRTRTANLSRALGMVEYSTDLAKYMTAIYPAEIPYHSLGQVVSEQGMTQLRIAETEKYAHVTFFINGGRDREFNGERRILVPSPLVATYDLAPGMSAVDVTDKLVNAIESGTFDLIIVNYANGDMVGHTGILSAAIEAAKIVDICLSRVEKAVEDAGGCLLVTADHGNCELMVDLENGGAHTAHTVGVVPVVLVNGPDAVTSLKDGRLADIAPTILDLIGLPQPEVMTGQSLLDRPAEAPNRAAE